jgi:hypothetical protein
MVIRKYKLFEQNLEVNDELSKLLDMAIDTDELDIVKFFVSKGARSTDETSEKASYSDDIFRYLLENKYKIDLSTDRLKELDVQIALIDYNKHQTIVDSVYFNDSLKYDVKYNKLVDDYFKAQGPSEDAFRWAKDNKELFTYFLSKGGNFKDLPDNLLRRLEVQKALIDFGEDLFVKDVGFNPKLREDPKYKHWLDMTDDIGKFNM